MNTPKQKREKLVILIADDDEEDRMLTEEALEEIQMASNLQFVEDGEEALNYLHNSGKFTDKNKFPIPHLILLDLNMPKKDGRDVLAEIKQHERLKKIPVVILTTSNSGEDIRNMYSAGVNSYITKPVSYQGMLDAMSSLKNYWFNIVSLPGE